MLRITLDTNVIIHGFSLQDPDIELQEEVMELFNLVLDGGAAVATTHVLSREIQRGIEKGRPTYSKLLMTIPQLPSYAPDQKYGIDKEGNRFWHSEMCEELVGLTFKEIQMKLMDILGSNKKIGSKNYFNTLEDCEHLTTHLFSMNDLFVTEDTGILDKSHLLKKFKLKVVPILDAISEIEYDAMPVEDLWQ